jgi:predicted amidohydrolase
MEEVKAKEELTIKELKEVFKACEVLAEAAGKVMKDGKVDMADLAVLPELALEFPVFKDAVSDADKILAELKDLKEDEVLEIIMCAYKVAAAFNGAK